MAAKSQLPKGQDAVLSSLNTAIDGLDLAKEMTTMTLAKAAFGSASILLITIRVGFLPVYVGRTLADVYRTHLSQNWTTSN